MANLCHPTDQSGWVSTLLVKAAVIQVVEEKSKITEAANIPDRAISVTVHTSLNLDRNAIGIVWKP